MSWDIMGYQDTRTPAHEGYGGSGWPYAESHIDDVRQMSLLLLSILWATMARLPFSTPLVCQCFPHGSGCFIYVAQGSTVVVAALIADFTGHVVAVAAFVAAMQQLMPLLLLLLQLV